jgi:transposase
MEELKKKYTPYTESERMSYIREYLSTSETKYQFAKRTGICRRLLILWLDKYHINDKVMSTEQPSLRKASGEYSPYLGDRNICISRCHVYQ